MAYGSDPNLTPEPLYQEVQPWALGWGLGGVHPPSAELASLGRGMKNWTVLYHERDQSPKL